MIAPIRNRWSLWFRYGWCLLVGHRAFPDQGPCDCKAQVVAPQCSRCRTLICVGHTKVR